MSQISDLVADSKLETRFHPEAKYVCHVYVESDPTGGQRTVSRREYWQRRKHIGSGGFGSVWLEKCVKGKQEGEMRAVKEIQRPRKQFECDRELEAIAKFSHQRYSRCFVKSYGWYEHGSTFYLAMEYYPLGDLQSYLNDIDNPLPEAEVQQIVYQILEGLQFMHSNGFAHRDIKPANILMQSRPPDGEWWVKISDFGISKRFRDSQGVSSTVKGTPAFMAPELHGFKARNSHSDPPCPNSVDIWALGEITHQLLTRRQAFEKIATLYSYIQGNQQFPVDRLLTQSISRNAISLISNMMQAVPVIRYTAELALQSEWFAHLRPPPSPPPEEFDLPEVPDMMASMWIGEPSNKWSTLTITQEASRLPSMQTNHIETVREYVPSELANHPSPAGYRSSEVRCDTVVHNDHPKAIQDDTIIQDNQPREIQHKTVVYDNHPKGLRYNTDAHNIRPKEIRNPIENYTIEENINLMFVCATTASDRPGDFVFDLCIDQKQVAFGYQDGTVEIYKLPIGNIMDGEEYGKTKLISRCNVAKGIKSIALDPQKERFAYGRQNGHCAVCDYRGRDLAVNTAKAWTNGQPVTSIKFIRASEPGVLICTESVLPKVWNRKNVTATTFPPVTTKNGSQTYPFFDRTAVSHDKNFLAICLPEYKTIRLAIIDLSTTEIVSIPPYVPGMFRFGVTFSRDGTLLAYAGETSITLWEIMRQRIHLEISKNASKFAHLVFSHDGKLLAGSSQYVNGKSNVQVWDCTTGERKVSISDVGVQGIEFCEDNTLVGVCSKTCEAGLWKARGVYKIASVDRILPRGESSRTMLNEKGERYPYDEFVTMKQYPPTAKRTVGWETSQAKTNGPSQLTSPRPMSTRPQPAIVTRSMLQPVAGLADMSLGPVRIPNLRNLKHRKERLLYMPMPDYCKPSGNLVAISPDGTVSANVMKDSTAIFVSHIFSEDNNPKLFTVPNYGSALSWVAVCKSRVAYGYQGGIMEWDLKMPGNPGKGWNISENDGHSKMAAYSNDGSIFAYIQSKTYSVIGVSSKPEYTTPSGAKQFPRLPRTRRVESRSELVRLALSPSGDFLAICRIQENSFSQMKAVRINVISVQAVLDALDDHLDDSLGGFWTPGDSCHAMEFSPNGSLLAFITGKRLHVWKVEEGRSGRVYIQDQNQFRTLGELFLDVKSGQPYLAFCPKSHFLVVLTTHSLEFRVINCRTGIVYTVSWQQDSVLASKYWLTGPLFFMPQGGLMAFCYGHFRPTIGDSDESESDQSQSAKCIGIFELASPSDLDQMEVGNKTLSTTKSSS